MDNYIKELVNNAVAEATKPNENDGLASRCTKYIQTHLPMESVIKGFGNGITILLRFDDSTFVRQQMWNAYQVTNVYATFQHPALEDCEVILNLQANLSTNVMGTWEKLDDKELMCAVIKAVEHHLHRIPNIMWNFEDLKFDKDEHMLNMCAFLLMSHLDDRTSFNFIERSFISIRKQYKNTKLSKTMTASLRNLIAVSSKPVFSVYEDDDGISLVASLGKLYRILSCDKVGEGLILRDRSTKTSARMKLARTLTK